MSEDGSGPEAPYDGPLSELELCFGGRKLRLVKPADPDRLLNDADVLELNRRDDYMPYWAYLWPGAFLLAESVVREAWPQGIEALEIGCGLGVAGLVALQAGVARVTFTDYEEAAFPFVRRAALANGIEPDRFATRRLDWRELPDESYPLILGADVLYERRLVPLVANLVARMLAPGGVALVAGPYRVATVELIPTLDTFGLRAECSDLTSVDDAGRTVRGTLYRIRHADGERVGSDNPCPQPANSGLGQ